MRTAPTKLKEAMSRLAFARRDADFTNHRGDAALAAEAAADDIIRKVTLRLASAQEELSASQAPVLAVEAAAASAILSAAAAALTATSERSMANAASDESVAAHNEYQNLQDLVRENASALVSVIAAETADKAAHAASLAETATATADAEGVLDSLRTAQAASLKREAAANARVTHAVALADKADAEEARLTAEKNHLEGYLASSAVRDKRKLMADLGAEQKDASTTLEKTMQLMRKRGVYFFGGHSGIESCVAEDSPADINTVKRITSQADEAVRMTREASRETIAKLEQCQESIRQVKSGPLPEAEARASHSRTLLTAAVRGRVVRMSDEDLAPALRDAWSTLSDAHFAISAMNKLIQDATPARPRESVDAEDFSDGSHTEPAPMTPTKVKSSLPALTALTPMARELVSDPGTASLWAEPLSAGAPAAQAHWLSLGYEALRTAAVTAGVAGAACADAAVVSLPPVATLSEIMSSDSALDSVLARAKRAEDEAASDVASLERACDAGALFLSRTGAHMMALAKIKEDIMRSTDEVSALSAAAAAAASSRVDTSDRGVAAAAQSEIDAITLRTSAASKSAFSRLAVLRASLGKRLEALRESNVALRIESLRQKDFR